ncbi:MAG TPA: ABC transporter permease [Candidatus Dormibacteraeota bacterium]|nr:ABC transporter permease [Candidatus Dormibacteraeota bacterium]
MSIASFLSDSIAVAENEFRLFHRNRTAILISLVVLPLFFTVSLGAGQGGAGTTFSPTAHIPIAWVDNDNSLASIRLFETLATSPDFHNLIEGYTEQGALAQLGTKRIYAVIVVPKGFQNDLENGNQARVILYTDDSEPGVSDQIQTTLTSYTQNFDPNVEVQPYLSQLQRQSVAGVGIVMKGTTFAGFNVGLTTVLAIVQIFAGFYEIAGGMSREREDGTYARLLVSPVPIGSVMLGKTLFDILLSVIRTFTVLAISVYGYGARPNTDIVTLLTLSLIVALVTMGIGFVVAALKMGQRAVVIIEFFLILFLFAFSGLIIDSNLLVGISQVISYLLPFTYAFDALKRTILLGRPLLSLTFDLEYLIGSMLISYAIAFLLLHFFRERLIT